MHYVEDDPESGRFLMIHTENIHDPADIPKIRAWLEGWPIPRAVLWDGIRNPWWPDDRPWNEVGDEAYYWSHFPHCSECGELYDVCFENIVSQCRSRRALLVIPWIGPIFGNMDAARELLKSGLQFLAFEDYVDSRESLIREIRKSGKPFDREYLKSVLDQAPKLNIRYDCPSWLFSSKSENIRDALRAAKARGVRLGNPRIEEARAKAHAALQAAKPSPQTLALMKTWRQEGKTLREIARVLNEQGIKPPRAKLWGHTSVKNQLS